MMFKFDGVDQSGAGNFQDGLFVVFLQRSLLTRMGPDELLDAGVQTWVFNQALIFRIRELLYCFQFGYGVRAKYHPEFFRALFRIELEPALLRDLDPLILRQMRQAFIRSRRRKQNGKGRWASYARRAFVQNVQVSGLRTADI